MPGDNVAALLIIISERAKMGQLQKYIGRMVRLSAPSFKRVAECVPNRAAELENCFIVAEVQHRARKLVCYGQTLRITVGASDVVLV